LYSYTKSICLYISHASGKKQRDSREKNEKAENSEERDKTVRAPPWDSNVHAEQTANQVERNEDGCNQSYLTENFVGSVSLGEVVN